MSKITCKNLNFSYPDKKRKSSIQVFLDFNVVFPNNKVSVVLGESGSGKTTLLNIISGLKNNYSGEVLFDETDSRALTMRDKDLSYITQKPILYPRMTVFENIVFPLKFTLLRQEEINFRVREIAKKLSIDHLLTRKPKYISYGQQQRVALARALIKEPTLLLCDEPFVGLDPIIKNELSLFLKDYLKKNKVTCVYVTHNYEEAVRIGDEIYLLENGKITLHGDNKKIRVSNNDYLKALIKESKLKEEEING